MKSKKHTESAMVKAVQQSESGISTEIICRELGISRATLIQLSIEKSSGVYEGMVIIRYCDSQNVEAKIQSDLDDI